MLYRADFLYDCADFYSLQSDPAVKLHGALMNHVPQKIAEDMHKSNYHPFSLYCQPTIQKSMVARFSVLTDAAAELLDYFSELQTVMLFGMQKPVHLLGQTEAVPITLAEAAERLACDTVELCFLTPAMVRKHGRDFAPPSPEAYFTSVMKKLEVFEGIVVTQAEFRAAWEACLPIDYRLELERHRITGYEKSGMVGTLRMRLPQDKAQAELIRTLLAYAEYSGIGGKTTQGMGALTVTAVR